MDDAEVVGLLTEVEGLGRRVDALRVALAGEVAERSRRELGREGLAARLGCRNAVELIQRTTGASTTTVNRRIRLGTATRAFDQPHRCTGAAERSPPSRAPFDAGALGFDGACAIVDTLTPALRVTGARQVGVAEAEIVAGAVAPDAASPVRLDADSVRLQATVWRSVLDPDGAAPTERDTERRCLRLLAPRHGLIPVTGMLMPEVAGALQAYADACTNPRTPEVPGPHEYRANANASATADAGDDAGSSGTSCASATGDAGDAGGAAAGGAAAGSGDAQREGQFDPGERRSGPQLLHDTLAAVIRVAARAADAPSLAGNAPTLVVTVRAQDLTTGHGAAFTTGLPTPISINAARHIGCAGAVQRIVFAPNGRITTLGTPQRCFTGNQRRAIAVRDGGCVIPGCHVPAGWCEVHHVTPHAHDPDGTHTDNGVLLCWFHHRTIDTSGWQIRMRAGLPQVKAPPWLDHTGSWRPGTGSPARIAERRVALRETTPDDAGSRCA